MLDHIVRIEPLRSAQGVEDGTDTLAQVLSAPICHKVARSRSAFDREESAVCDHWVLAKEVRKQLKMYASSDRRTRLIK